MIRHMRHGSPPRLMALQSILSLNRRESLPTPSAGDRIRRAGENSALKAPPKLFAAETTAPVLDPGRGRTKTGQLGAYAGAMIAPGVRAIHPEWSTPTRPIPLKQRHSSLVCL